MIYDINDFELPDQLIPCISPQDDITLDDGSIILPDGIGKVWFGFEVSGRTKCLYLSEVRYCKKLDTKLISLDMLDRKVLAYSAEKGVLLIKDNAMTVIEGRLDKHNLYRVTLNNSMVIVSLQDCAMAASISKFLADIVTWHRRFAHLNATYLKRLPNMTSGMKILSGNSELPFCSPCVQSKMTRQPHRNPHTPSDIPGLYIHLDVGGSANLHATWKGYRYFALLVDDATKVTWVRFMKKKSKALSIFRDFVVRMERH